MAGAGVKGASGLVVGNLSGSFVESGRLPGGSDRRNLSNKNWAKRGQSGGEGCEEGTKRRKSRGEKDVVWVQTCAESWEDRLRGAHPTWAWPASVTEYSASVLPGSLSRCTEGAQAGTLGRERQGEICGHIHLSPHSQNAHVASAEHLAECGFTQGLRGFPGF